MISFAITIKIHQIYTIFFNFVLIPLPENKNGKASASRGDVVSEPVAPAAAIARILRLFNPFDRLKNVL